MTKCAVRKDRIQRRRDAVEGSQLSFRVCVERNAGCGSKGGKPLAPWMRISWGDVVPFERNNARARGRSGP